MYNYEQHYYVFHLHFWKIDDLLDAEFLVNFFFPGAVENVIPISFCYFHRWNVSCSLYYCSPVCNVSFFFVAFKIFSLSLAFSNMTMMCLSMAVFIIIFGIYWASWVCKLMFFTQFGRISTIFFKYFFLFFFSLPSHSGIQITHMEHLILSYRSLRCFHFL